MYFVYILKCENSSLYTGITTDLCRRFSEHCGKGGKGAKYTSSFHPVGFVAAWKCADKSAASKLEYAIKALTKAQKEALIEENKSDKIDLTGYTRLRIKENGEIVLVTRQEIIDYCLTYPGVYEDYPFDDISKSPESWTCMRHLGGGKIFALIYERQGLAVNLKCDPILADIFRQNFEGVTEGYHMNKKHWNTVRPDTDVSWDDLCNMIDHSFELTRKKTRSKKNENS